MPRRRYWSQALVFRVGKKYQQSVCSSACLCGNSDHRARVLSRRGFLARSAAAAAPERACAQTMGITKQISGRPGQEVVAALDGDNDRLVPTYKDLRHNPKGVSWKSTKVGQHRQPAQRTWIPGQNRNRRDGIVGITQTVSNRRSSTARWGCQCGSRGDDGAEASAAKPTLKGDEP
jgi:hypothetical protein